MKTESELLDGLRRGDDDAYEEMIRRYGGRMLAVARRLLRCEDDAHDAFQEACLNAFRSVQNFREGSQLSTWLHRIVVNAALMRLRSASRRPEVSLEPLLPTFDETGHHTSPVEPLTIGPDTLLDRRETRRKVRECIDRLPATHRTILVLRDLEELDTEETAERLGISENAVKIRLHRARQALAALLGASHDTQDSRRFAAAS
jgi:RNA polymerase sigma-70 factor, ECF subfamily